MVMARHKYACDTYHQSFIYFVFFQTKRKDTKKDDDDVCMYKGRRANTFFSQRNVHQKEREI